MRLIIFLVFCVLAQAVLGADPKYPVSDIPEEMKKGMYGVIRDEQTILTIQSKNASSLYYKKVITILNSKANRYASLVVGYDKMRSIKTFRATVYDAQGKEIKKLKQNEIRDQSDYDGAGAYSDVRLKYANLAQAVYPYTIELEYEVQMKFLYSAPDFFLYNDDEVSIQQSTYKIVYPVHLKPRTKLFKVNAPTTEFTKDGKEVMSWSFEKVIPQKFEPFSPDSEKIIPNIKTSPIEFDYAGYAGNMSSWKEYGMWQLKLNEGRDQLPEATRQKVKELTRNATSDEEKVKILYTYLQSKTRYVSIQLGIGGFQPFEAKVVDQTGYGDCKALSNYMVALLKEVGITGYYATIMAGRNEAEVDKDFPSDQSNHVIVAVPNKSDTLWLECTSQSNPFGWLGSFTNDRYALLTTPDGGVLVKTPDVATEHNTQIRKAIVNLTASGDATAKIETIYAGMQYENNGLDFILDNQFDEQKKWVEANTNIATFDINSFKMQNVKDKIPSAIVSLDLNLRKLASVSGKRLFVTPNLMNRSTYVPEKIAERKTPVVQRTTYIDIDSIHYTLPEGIYPEFVPEPVVIKSAFGEYEASYKIDDQGLFYIRKIKMNKGKFPASSYPEMIDFYKNINKADNAKLVFLNKT